MAMTMNEVIALLAECGRRAQELQRQQNETADGEPVRSPSPSAASDALADDQERNEEDTL